MAVLAVVSLAGRAMAGGGGDRSIVVLRHGADLSSWVQAGNPQPTNVGYPTTYWHPMNLGWPNYTRSYSVVSNSGVVPATATGSTITVKQFGLSEAGAMAATQLAQALPDFLASRGCAPITRVITKNPIATDGTTWPTPNPFDTIYPCIKQGGPLASARLLLIKKNTVSGQIVDRGMLALIGLTKGANKILPEDDGSAMICWDREGLWGKSGGRLNHDSILYKLGKQWGDPNKDYIKSVGQPAKCDTIYIFRSNGKLEIYSFQNGTFTKKQGQPS